MDVLTIIKQEHDEVKALFKQFDELGERAAVTRGKLGAKIMSELEAHTKAEDVTLYAELRGAVADRDDRLDVLEGYEEHAAASALIAKLKGTDPSDDTNVARMTVLRESVEHHIKEEEGVLHKLARELFDKGELDALGERYRAAKLQAEAMS